MALPTKAFLVFGLLLTSAEAWAQQDTDVAIDQNRTLQRIPGQPNPASFFARASAAPDVTQHPRRVRPPRNLEKRIRSTRGKGPVSARVAAAEASIDLPQARVLTSRNDET